MSDAPEPTQEPTDNASFWSSLEEEADLTLEQQGLDPDMVVTMSTPTGAKATVVVTGPTSIRNLITNAGLSVSPSAQYIVDGTFVDIDHEVSPGGHVSVSVPLKAG